MVLDDDIISWPRAVGWAVLAWLALGLAAFIEPQLPGSTPWLLMAAPLLVVFMVGVHERGVWWIYGSLVTLVPLVVLLLWVLASLVIGDASTTTGSGMALGILLVAGPLAIGGSAVALAVASSLGVWTGRRLAVRRFPAS